MLGLNEPLIPGKDWYLESSRKLMQTTLTNTPLSMLNKNKKKTALSGGIFKNAAFKDLGIDDTYGDFDLQGRAGATPDQVKRGLENYKKYVINERNKIIAQKNLKRKKNKLKAYTEKDFTKEYGEVFPTVDVDALLYSDKILREFDPYLPKTASVKASDVKSYFNKKG